ncbi:unnamed protein product [Arabis nemorensis]|uniref:Uncharacterized protein n=1 Tax=Arabis nemorensis TaxID=586526 RepID=A0A565CBA5_9BRAS|nr:unnamed protein product [Arabis nemorensis]
MVAIRKRLGVTGKNQFGFLRRKRAHAHQRRRCVEQQQSQQNQPFIAVKVELEQLVVSILDDPSVSRVMREAGLSSVSDELNGLRKKWNRFCQTLHHRKPGMTARSYGWGTEQSSSVFPDTAATISFVDSGMKQNSRASSLVAKFRRQNSCTLEFSFGSNHQEGLKKNLTDELSLDGSRLTIMKVWKPRSLLHMVILHSHL